MGGIAALHDMSVTATTGDLMNQGTMYAGNALTAHADAGTLTNAATLSAYQGSINAGSSIYLKASTVLNNSTIDSEGSSITLVGNAVRNEVVGGDSRTWSGETAHSTPVQTNSWSSYSAPDDNDYWSYSQTWSKQQSFAAGAPLVKPEIIGATTVSLTFNTGTNLGGVISGSTVNLTGTGAGATFVNELTSRCKSPTTPGPGTSTPSTRPWGQRRTTPTESKATPRPT